MPLLYVFDTNSFRVLGNYYPETFSTLWENINAIVADGSLGSVREVRKELEFLNASEQAVAEIFAVPHFNAQMISERARLRGQPVADPFVIARARLVQACVVTEERAKPNAAKIPNVCQHFSVDCTNVQGFLQRQGWRF